jgi:hypothetical protein
METQANKAAPLFKAALSTPASPVIYSGTFERGTADEGVVQEPEVTAKRGTDEGSIAHERDAIEQREATKGKPSSAQP